MAPPSLQLELCYSMQHRQRVQALRCALVTHPVQHSWRMHSKPGLCFESIVRLTLRQQQRHPATKALQQHGSHIG